MCCSTSHTYKKTDKQTLAEILCAEIDRALKLIVIGINKAVTIPYVSSQTVKGINLTYKAYFKLNRLFQIHKLGRMFCGL